MPERSAAIGLTSWKRSTTAYTNQRRLQRPCKKARGREIGPRSPGQIAEIGDIGHGKASPCDGSADSPTCRDQRDQLDQCLAPAGSRYGPRATASAALA